MDHGTKTGDNRIIIIGCDWLPSPSLYPVRSHLGPGLGYSVQRAAGSLAHLDIALRLHVMPEEIGGISPAIIALVWYDFPHRQPCLLLRLKKV
jgi:hypothetical protein